MCWLSNNPIFPDLQYNNHLLLCDNHEKQFENRKLGKQRRKQAIEFLITYGIDIV